MRNVILDHLLFLSHTFSTTNISLRSVKKLLGLSFDLPIRVFPVKYLEKKFSSQEKCWITLQRLYFATFSQKKIQEEEKTLFKKSPRTRAVAKSHLGLERIAFVMGLFLIFFSEGRYWQLSNVICVCSQNKGVAKNNVSPNFHNFIFMK